MQRSQSVSVVVLAQGSSKAIERSLISVARQTIRPSLINLLVPAGLAVDHSAIDRLARRYGAKVIIESHMGATPLSTCFDADFDSQWISFLRAGDEFFRSYLAVMTNTFADSALLAVASSLADEMISPDLLYDPSSKEPDSNGLVAAIQAAAAGRRYASISTLIVHRSLLSSASAPPFEEGYEDDFACIPRLMVRLGDAAKLLPLQLVLSNITSTSSPTELRLLSELRLARLVEDVVACKDDHVFRQALSGLSLFLPNEAGDRVTLLIKAADNVRGPHRKYIRLHLLQRCLSMAMTQGELERAYDIRQRLISAQLGWVEDRASKANVSLETEARLRQDLVASRRREKDRGVTTFRSVSPRRDAGSVRKREDVTFDLSKPRSGLRAFVGLSPPESWGCWIDGPLARLVLPMPESWDPCALVINAEYVFRWGEDAGMAYVCQDTYDECEVRFEAGKPFILALGAAFSSTQITIRPRGYKQEGQEPIWEKRKLSIGLSSITLTNTPP